MADRLPASPVGVLVLVCAAFALILVFALWYVFGYTLTIEPTKEATASASGLEKASSKTTATLGEIKTTTTLSSATTTQTATSGSAKTCPGGYSYNDSIGKCCSPKLSGTVMNTNWNTIPDSDTAILASMGYKASQLLSEMNYNCHIMSDKSGGASYEPQKDNPVGDFKIDLGDGIYCKDKIPLTLVCV